MNKNIIRILCTLLLATLLAGCERRPLLEATNTHHVRIYIDEGIKNVTYGFYNPNYARPAYKAPDVMRVLLADPITGYVQAERFLRDKGKDERGTYYEGHIIADPGEYSLMAYNFDTETSIVDEGTSFEEAKVFTGEIASYLKAKISSRADSDFPEDEKIVYESDPVFIANCDKVKIGHTDKITSITGADGNHLTAQNIVKSYYLQVKVKGIEYAASTVGLLTGLSGSCRMVDGSMNTKDSVTVYFELNPDAAKSAGIQRSIPGSEALENDSTVTLYTTFSTFGKIPDLKNKLKITFDFITVYGKSYSETFDISETFLTPEGTENQWLLIDHVITIPAPPPSGGGSGLNPEVDDWGDINTDIKI